MSDWTLTFLVVLDRRFHGLLQELVELLVEGLQLGADEGEADRGRAEGAHPLRDGRDEPRGRLLYGQ